MVAHHRSLERKHTMTKREGKAESIVQAMLEAE
jgi:hypothetical protein